MRRRDGGERDAKLAVGELAELLQSLIKGVALLFGATFAWLQLEKTPLTRIFEVFDERSIVIIGLCLLFSGWVVGAGADTRIQRDALGVDPRLARLGPLEWVGIASFVVLLMAVFALHDVPILFQTLLTLSVACNVWTWRIILRRTRPMIEATARRLTAAHDNFGLLRLALMTDYMNGSWQRTRFLVLILLAGVQVPVAVLHRDGVLAAVLGPFSIGGIAGERLSGYATGLLFLGWVIVSELWMKVYRIKLRSDMRLLDYMGDYLELHRRGGQPAPPLALRGTFDFTRSANRNYA